MFYAANPVSLRSTFYAPPGIFATTPLDTVHLLTGTMYSEQPRKVRHQATVD